MKRVGVSVLPVVLIPAMFSGCEFWEENQGYLATVAAEVVFVNVPSDQLNELGLSVPSATTVLVAIGRLTNPETTSANPFSADVVADAVVKIETPEGTFQLQAQQDSPGLYLLTSIDEPGLTYTVGANYRISMNISGEQHWVKLTAAAPVDLVSPSSMGAYHQAGTDLAIEWTQPSDNVLLSMFDKDGNEVYNNLPTELNDIYAFLTQQPTTSSTLPGNLFEESQIYGIGIAGLERLNVDSTSVSSNLNYLATIAVSGAGVVTGVTTMEMPTIPPDLQ